MIASPLTAQIIRQKKILPDGDEPPILRFPFAKFLANPCGFGSPSIRNYVGKSIANRNLPKLSDSKTERRYSSSALDIDGNSSSLAQETAQFLEPFRQRYNSIDRNSFSKEELGKIIKEFLLIVHQVKFRSKILQPQMVIYHKLNHDLFQILIC